MEVIFRAKLVQHPDIATVLQMSGTRELLKVYDVDYFWGTGADGTGENQVGKLWMKLLASTCLAFVQINALMSIGGTVEVGETLVQAVRREVLEEVGAEVLAIEYLGHREVFRETAGIQTHWIGFDYKVLVDPQTVSIKEPDMCSQLRWCSLSEIPLPKQSQMDYKIAKYQEKL